MNDIHAPVKPLTNPDFGNLKWIVECYMQYRRDGSEFNGDEEWYTYIFGEAVHAVYGPDIFKELDRLDRERATRSGHAQG